MIFWCLIFPLPETETVNSFSSMEWHIFCFPVCMKFDNFSVKSMKDNMAAMDPHYMSNGSYFKNGMASPKNGRYNGSFYTMTGSGAQVLMNTHTKSLQFLPPIRTKTTMCPAVSSPTLFMNALNFNETKMQLNSLATMKTMTTAAIAGIPTKFDTLNYGTSSDTKTEGYTLFNTIKSFFTNLLHLIFSTATATKTQYFPLATENNSGYATINKKSHESANVYMNVMPADGETFTYFDCDDYVDNEDTVDFIAGTTPKFDDEFVYEQFTSTSDLSPNSSAYFDCVSSFMEKEIEKTDPFTECIQNEPPNETIVEAKSVKMCTSAQTQNIDCGLNKESDQQNVDKLKCRYRSNNHKQKRRNPNKTIHRSSKSLMANKNRNKKHRHELVQMIHDDIECIQESVSDFCQDDDDCIDNDMDTR